MTPHTCKYNTSGIYLTSIEHVLTSVSADVPDAGSFRFRDDDTLSFTTGSSDSNADLADGDPAPDSADGDPAEAALGSPEDPCGDSGSSEPPACCKGINGGISTRTPK